MSTAPPIAAMARQIVLNAKMRRTGVCGATETLLVDRRAQRPAAGDPRRSARRRLRSARRRRDAALDRAREAGDGGRLGHRISRRDHRGEGGRRRRRRDRAHQPPRLAPHRGDRHRRRGRGRALPGAGRQRHRAAQRLDPVRRRRRVRHGRRDRHLDRQAARRAGRSAPSSSPATNTSCAAPARCGRRNPKGYGPSAPIKRTS